MKAAMITKFGPPETLKIVDIPRPVPEKSEVLIRVVTIGVNFADIMARVGVYPNIPKAPFVPGIEVAGIIEEIGAEVNHLKKGDRVVAFTKQGGYAEFVCTSEKNVRPIPDSLSFEDAASIVVTSFTAYHGLVTLANIQPKEKLLLHASAGGVGSIAIQMAKQLGAEVYATASSEKKLEIARSLGADHVMTYGKNDFSEYIKKETSNYGVDVVMDSIGGTIMRRSMKLLAPMGRYVLYGFAAVTGKRKISKLKALKEIIAAPLIHPPSIITQNIGIFGFNLYFLDHKVEYLQKASSILFDWIEKKKIRPFIGAKFRLDEIVEAHRFIQSRQSVGKIVINVS